MTDRDELEALRARYAALEARADALAHEASETARALMDALDAQRAALERAGESAARLAAIRASNSGRASGFYATWRVRLRRARLEAKRRAWLRRAGRRRLAVPQAVRAAAPGVNVAGYINAESGMGEAARCSIRALQLAGLPVTLNNVKGPQRTQDLSFTEFSDENPHPFNLIHLNADNMAWFAGQRGRSYFADHYTIGYWFWELEEFRPDWLPAFDLVDEVWVASAHTQRAIGNRAPVPVIHMPLGLPDPVDSQVGRAHFGLPERAFIFLYTFDVSSQMERKNPLAAIRAFRLANLPHDDAVLLLKFTNGDANRDAVRQLVDAARGLNVHLLDGALHRDEIGALMRTTDACLSLHRAEGFGLTLAEQMALGKPAIATAYSGNLDFMNEDVSCLVPARLIEIDRDYGPYLTGYHWADPDVEAAAAFMRDLVEHPTRARELGEKGRNHVRKVLSLSRSSALMGQRLAQIQRGELKPAGAAGFSPPDLADDGGLKPAAPAVPNDGGLKPAAPPVAAPPVAATSAAQHALAAARVHGWHAADTAERLAQQREREYIRVRDSRVRRMLIRGRRVVTLPVYAVAHPVQSLQRTGSWIRARFSISQLTPMIEHARFASAPLGGIAPFRQESDRVEPDQSIRWLGPVRIGGVVRRVLFAHPNALVVWRVPVTPDMVVVANCAIEPEAGRNNPLGLEFGLEVRQVDGPWSRSVTRLLHPRLRSTDRRWRRMAIDVPETLAGEIEIRLTTRMPNLEVPDFAWAFWGEPRLLRRRPLPEIARLARVNLQQQGLIGAVRRLRQIDVQDGRASYARWLTLHARSPKDLATLARDVATLPLQPTISIITPVYNTDVPWLRACVESVRQQVYPHWELCLADDCSTSAETIRALDEYATLDPRIKLVRLPTNSHISAASNAALDVATGDFIALLDHDDELAPEALSEVVRAINAHPDVDFLYTDEDKKDLAGARIDPYFKPDWSPEHFLNFMYTNHLMVLRRAVVDRVGRFRLGFEGAQDFDLALRVVATTDRIQHVPHVLYHWRQIPGSAAADAVAKPWALANAKRALESFAESTGLSASVEPGAAPGLFRVRRALASTPLVTLVITTDDRTREVNGKPLALLPNLVRSVRDKTTYENYELLIIDNGRLSTSTAAVLATVPHRRVSYQIDGRFNFAHKLNFSVRHAHGDQLVILNDDVEVITPDWLESLLEHAQDPAIGAVGAKLYYPDGRLQHAGVVMGVCGIAAHVFHQADGTTPGYFGSTLGPRNYSALTGACMMTRRAVFDEVGGFNERLAIDFNDTDYCLRLRRAGYRLVFTPHAELYHHESGSHGVRTWNPAEANYMRANWPDVLAEDPYYNRNLSKDFPDYRL